MNYREFREKLGMADPTAPLKRGRKPETATVPGSSPEQAGMGNSATPRRKRGWKLKTETEETE
jgi:hypothetical protein